MAKVLVVDDSIGIRMQVARALTAAGFSTVEAGDGLAALAQIRAHGDVALAICDVNMPNMDGLQFLAEIRTVAPSLPVMMLTTEGTPLVAQQARALGARACIIKPCNLEHLVAAAKKLAA